MHQNVIKLYDENKNVEMTDFKVELFLNSGYKFNYFIYLIVDKCSI